MDVEQDQPAIEAPVDEGPRQDAAGPGEASRAAVVGVRAGDLVVEGSFAAVERYVLRPVAATAEALRRLRARSFRVAALGELLARCVAQRLGLTALLNTGVRFLLAGPAQPGWEEHLHSLQREFDIWLFQHLQPAGELHCDLAGALCQDERLPLAELEERRRQRRRQPLEGALRVGLRWNGRAFLLPAGPQTGHCSGCAAITSVRLFGHQTLCEGCATDTELRERLARAERAWLCTEQEADLPGPGLGLRFSAPADLAQEELPLDRDRWALLRRVPASPPSEGLVAAEGDRSALEGRGQLLGYLRLEVDGVAEALQTLEGDAAGTLALGRLLHDFFTGHAVELLEKEFPEVFPVSGGGDELLVMGPWQATLDLGVRLRQDFVGLAGHSLTLSAGLALAAPYVELSTGARQAAELLQVAKRAGGGRMNALGAVLEWERAASLVSTGKTLADWLQRRIISPAWLNRLARLRASGENGHAGRRAALHAAVMDSRIKQGPARAWAAQLLKPGEAGGDSDWAWMEFLAHYALTAYQPKAIGSLNQRFIEAPAQ